MSKILIIDDSRFQRTILQNILKNDGHQVLEATSGRAGLTMAESERPDLIILDLIMPEVDGFSVLSILKQSQSDIPVVILSADIQKATREECLQAGAAAFLNKPVDPPELARTIRDVLG